jgi:hypothetical protein
MLPCDPIPISPERSVGSADDQTEIPISSVLHGIMKALLADLLDH